MSNDIALSNAAITAIPGTSAQVNLFDTTAGYGSGTTLRHRHQFMRVRRATVRIFADKDVTFFAASLTANSTTWRVYNGLGAGEVASANVLFQRDVLFFGDETLLYVTTGATPITVWECSVRLTETDRSVGQ